MTIVLSAGVLAVRAHAQPVQFSGQPQTGGAGQDIPTGTLDDRRWLRSFWLEAFGRTIIQETGLIFEQQGTVQTQLDVFEFRSPETFDRIDADGTFQVYTWENQITMPVPPDMMSILNAGGVIDARFGAMVGRLTTTTGFDQEIVGYTFEIDVLDTLGNQRTLVNFFPMAEVGPGDTWYNVYNPYEDMILDSGEETLCSSGNDVPGTPLGDYCLCMSRAKSDFKSKVLRDTAKMILRSGIAFSGCLLTGPAAPVCDLILGSVIVGSHTLNLIADVNDYNSDVDACEYTYCAAVGCP